jgi:hypothetical protein
VTRDVPNPRLSQALANAARAADRTTVVAQLETDSPAPAATSALSRRLTFAARDCSIVFDVTWTGYEYTGALTVHPLRRFEVSVHGSEDSRVFEVLRAHCYDGSASLARLPLGPCKVTLSSDTTQVETEWVTLPRPDVAD